MAIPTPTPQYIDFDIVYPYISQQINVSNTPVPEPGTIAKATVEQQIAMAEADVELDLQTYYAIPFQTLDGQDWTNLSTSTYTYLYKAFIQRSIYNIYRIYYGLTGENKGEDYWTSALSAYNELLKRFYKLDQTENYLYPAFTDMKTNKVGMRRILKPSQVGLLGGFATDNASYAIVNGNKPRFNWG